MKYRPSSNECKQSSVGFTGTRKGMNPSQRLRLERALRTLAERCEFFHHGDCLGADAEAAAIAKNLGYKIVMHPPTNLAFRAFVADPHYTFPLDDYIARNHSIVDCSRVLIAAPEMDEHTPAMQRSGTWATVRYARRQGIKVRLLARVL